MGIQVLQRLHQPAAHVPRLCSLDGCVHQALPPPHGVEEELGGAEAGVEGGGDEALALGSLVPSGEMGQTPVLQACPPPHPCQGDETAFVPFTRLEQAQYCYGMWLEQAQYCYGMRLEQAQYCYGMWLEQVQYCYGMWLEQAQYCYGMCPAGEASCVCTKWFTHNICRLVQPEWAMDQSCHCP